MLLGVLDDCCTSHSDLLSCRWLQLMMLRIKFREINLEILNLRC